jgi:hypothetical protein
MPLNFFKKTSKGLVSVEVRLKLFPTVPSLKAFFTFFMSLFSAGSDAVALYSLLKEPTYRLREKPCDPTNSVAYLLGRFLGGWALWFKYAVYRGGARARFFRRWLVSLVRK